MLNNAYQNYPAESQPFPVLTCTEEKVAQNAISTKCHCLKNLNVEEFLELEFEHHMQMGRLLNAKCRSKAERSLVHLVDVTLKCFAGSFLDPLDMHMGKVLSSAGNLLTQL